MAQGGTHGSRKRLRLCAIALIALAPACGGKTDRDSDTGGVEPPSEPGPTLPRAGRVGDDRANAPGREGLVPNRRWIEQIAGEGWQDVVGIALDPSENILIGGAFEGALGLPGMQLAKDVDTGSVAKLDSGGEPIWAQCLTGDVFQITADTEGNAVLIGSGRMDLCQSVSPNAQPTDPGIFVGKLAPDGAPLWSVAVSGESSVSGVAVDGADGVVISGAIGSTIQLAGTDSGSTVACWGDCPKMALAKLDATGKYLWGLPAGSSYIDASGPVAVDEQGNVITAGRFDQTLSIGGGQVTATGTDYNLYLAKLDPAGSLLWAKGFPQTYSSAILDIAIDTDSGVVIAGTTSADIDFGDAYLTHDCGSESFVAKFDPAGAFLWVHRLVGDCSSSSPFLEVSVRRVAVAPDGDVLLTGLFRGPADFGDGLVEAGSGNSEIFVVRLDGSGNFLASSVSTQLGSTGQSTYGADVVATATADALVVGVFSETITFGGETLSAGANDRDLVLARLPE